MNKAKLIKEYKHDLDIEIPVVIAIDKNGVNCGCDCIGRAMDWKRDYFCGVFGEPLGGYEENERCEGCLKFYLEDERCDDVNK